MQVHLERLMEANNMKQIELANMTKIRPATICRLYNETAIQVRLEYLDRICDALDCSIGDLLEHVPKEDDAQIETDSK